MGPWLLGALTAAVLFLSAEVCNYNGELFQMTWDNAAMNVLGSYRITFNRHVLFAVLAGLGLCLLAFLCFWLERGQKRSWKRWGVQLLATALAVVGFFRFVCFDLRALNVSALDYEQAYRSYGFMQVSVDIFKKAAYKVSMPEDYGADGNYYQYGKRFNLRFPSVPVY